MFIVKFALELSLLTGLFFILKRYLFKSLGLYKKQNSPQGMEGLMNRLAYSLIFLGMGAIFSFIAFWMIYAIFNVVHSLGHYNGVLIAQQVGLITPSLIFGFYISTHLSEFVYTYFFGQQSLKLIPAYESYSNTSKRTFMGVFSAMTLIPALVLVALQFNVYLKIDGDKIYTRQMLQEERVYAMADVVKISPEGEEGFSLIMSDGHKIAMGAYSGNLNAFLDHLGL